MKKYFYSAVLPFNVVFFVFIAASLFCSGQYWSPTKNPIPVPQVQVLNLTDNVLWAGTSLGLYRTPHQDSIWEYVPGFEEKTIVEMKTFGKNKYVCPYSAGIFHTDNNGITWNNISGNLPQGTTVYAVLEIGGRLFVGTNFNGIYRSENNGATWDLVGFPLLEVRTIIAEGNDIIAGIHDVTSGQVGSVFRSPDLGKTWNRSDAGMTGTLVKVVGLHNRSYFAGTIGAGIFRSDDSAATWTSVNQGLTNKGVSALALQEEKAFAGTINGGVFYSTDTAETWRTANFGLTNTNVRDIIFWGETPIAATDGGGVFVCDLSISSTNDEAAAGNEAIKVSPNPAKDFCTISIPSKHIYSRKSVRVYNVVGELQAEFSAFDSRVLNIGIGDWSPGMYLVQISSDEFSQMVHFIKQ